MTSPASFPTLRGQAWPVKKKPLFSTRVAAHVSGREVRAPFYAFQLYEWTATLAALDSSANSYPGLGASSFWTLFGLFVEMQGQLGTFLYADPTDGSATAQALATADGTTTNFIFARTLGGRLEPAGWVTGTPNVYLNGSAIPAAGLSAPPAPTLSSTAGGSLGGATYYVKTNFVTASGDTVGSSESALAVASGHLLVVASPVSPGAAALAWNVFVSTSPGGEQMQNSPPITFGPGWTEPTGGLVTGAAPPSSNTTGWSVIEPNILAFAGPPADTIVVSADFTFSFQCRFLDDAMEFTEFMQNLWSADGIKFRSLRPLAPLPYLAVGPTFLDVTEGTP